MEGIGAEVSQKVKSAIKAKLVELGVYVDEELPDYIMVMVANKRSKSEMIEDLQLFLGTHTEKFISWLLQVLQKLHEVTVASLDAKRASSSISLEKDKEKVIKKKKLSSSEGEPESAKKDRKKKNEALKKDSGGKKTKKNNSLKKKPAKSDAAKSVEKSIDKTEMPVKEKKDGPDKPIEQASSSIEKSIPLNLPSTSRSNPKPVLMVSDEDDEDFINIRADAEADLLVSELQEEVRPSPPQPQKQLTEVPTAKSSEPALQRLSDKLITSSQESSRLVPAEDDMREPVMSTKKDVRLHYSDEESSVMLKGSQESVGQILTKPTLIKRTQAISSPELGLHHSQDSMERQAKVDEDKGSEVQRAQPTSKVTSVFRTGSIKSRLGKRPSKQDSPPKSDRTKAKGVTSVVKVKGRPKVPLSAQANKNLILKAVAEAQKSVASSLIRSESILKSHGLLTKKNRGEFSKIAVTLPNPRTTSTSQPVRRTLEDDTGRNQSSYRPVLMRNMPDSLQSQSRPMHSSMVPIDDLPSMRDFSSVRDLPSMRTLPSLRSLPSFRDLPSPRYDLPSISEVLAMTDHLSGRNLRDLSPVRDTSPDLHTMREMLGMNDRPLRNFSLSDLPPIALLRDQPSLRDLPALRDFSPISEVPSVHDLPSVRDLPTMDLQEPTLNLSQPTQSLSQSFQSQPQLSRSRSQLIQNQPQLITNQPQQPPSQSQLIQTQPQPDIVASLHEGHSSQSSIRRGGRNTVERMTMTERVASPTDASQRRSSADRLDSEIECTCPNREHGRDLEHASCTEGNCMCSDLQEESVEMQEKPVTPVVESPAETRPCSPQFFVTLNGYDARMPNGSGRVVRGGLSEKSRHFLVPERDDMDVDLEYMDEGIGEEDFKQEGEDVNEAEMMEDELEKDTDSTRPVIFRKVDPETSVDDGDISMKAKNSERCRFWPACRLGERCDFHHPTIPCKSFPNCKFGDKCLYIHPNCKFDSACTRKDCPFTHAIPRSLVIAPVPAPVRVTARPLSVQCRFFPKCTNVNCKFYHPKPCRFGKACNKYDCPYMHEREQLPPKDKLKWICPGKA